MQDQLVIRGAREHNLKNVSLTLPRQKLIVFPGLSGSGKSSLAFDTIYAEGQRRYVESMSAYARQFLGQMEKPDVDSIEGLSPAISIDQKSTAVPASTVGTVTEIFDYPPAVRAHALPLPALRYEIRQQTVDDRCPAGLPAHALQYWPHCARRAACEAAGGRRSGLQRVRIDGSSMSWMTPTRRKEETLTSGNRATSATFTSASTIPLRRRQQSGGLMASQIVPDGDITLFFAELRSSGLRRRLGEPTPHVSFNNLWRTHDVWLGTLIKISEI